MVNYAQIHDLEVLDTEKLRFSDVRKNLQMSDGVKRVTDIVRAPVINFIESDHEKFAQIVELLGNESFSPIQVFDDYSIDYYGDPVNFRHTLGGKDGNLRKFSITVQNHYWKLMMDWTSKESETHWDAITDDSFTQASSSQYNEGTTATGDSPDDYTWYAVNGNWNLNASDFNYCQGLNGRTHCMAVVVKDNDGSDIPATADGSFEASLDFYTDSTAIGLVIRCNKEVATAYGYGYVIYGRADTDKIYFAKNTGSASAILKEWDVDAFTGSAGLDWYSMKVVAQGNRFDIYWENEYLDTVIDETYSVGWHGVMSSGTVTYCDWWTWEVVKSVVVNMPVGAYDLDKVRMPDTTRLSDDTFSDGESVMIIAPEDPIEFRQEGSVYGGGEVKVFDLDNGDPSRSFLEFHAKCDEGSGTDVYDSSDHNRTVTEYNISVWTSSYRGSANYALDLSASNARFSFPMDGENLDDHAWTIGGRFKRDGIGSGHGISYFWDSTASTTAMDMIIDANDRLQLTIHGSGGDGVWRTAINSLETTDWFFMVVTWSGVLTEDPIVYIDGEVMSWATTGTITGDVYDVDLIWIAHNGVVDFDGDIDDIFIYSAVLTPSRISWLYDYMPSFGVTRRVYSSDHKFIGDIIVSNGLVRLVYEKVSTQIITGVYSNTKWDDITFLPDWSSLTLENIKAEITELTRYFVTLREACYYETVAGFDMVWTDYTIRTGSPMIHITNRRAL